MSAASDTPKIEVEHMHPLFLLAAITFILVSGFLLWTRISTSRHELGRTNPEGLGGVNDPLSGSTNKIRDPDVMRASLDEGRRPTLNKLPS